MPSPVTVRILSLGLGLAAVAGLGVGAAIAVRSSDTPARAGTTGTSTGTTTGASALTSATPPPTTSSRPSTTSTAAVTGPTTSPPAGSRPVAALSARGGLLRADQVPLPGVVMFNSATGKAAARNFELEDKSNHCWTQWEHLPNTVPPQFAVADYGNNEHVPTRRALLMVLVWDTARDAGMVAHDLDVTCFAMSLARLTSPGNDLVVGPEELKGPGWAGFVASEHYYQSSNPRFRTVVVRAGRTVVVLDVSTFDSSTRLSTEAVKQAALASLRQAGAL